MMSEVYNWLTGVMHDPGLWGFVIKSSLIMAGAIALMPIMRRTSPGLKHMVLRSAFIGVLLLAVLWPLLPSWDVTLPGYLEPIQNIPMVAGQATVSQVEASSASGTPMWMIFFLGIWLGGGIVAGARVVMGIINACRIRSTGREIVDDYFNEKAMAIAKDIGITSEVTFLCSERVAVPIVWGLFRPAIVLPGDYLLWSDERLMMILRHELAHVKRLDILWLNLSALVAIGLWFNPLVWVLRRRLIKESEYACDDFVLDVGTGAREYATHLVEYAREAQHARMKINAGIAFVNKRQLEGRIMSILNNVKSRKSPARSVGYILTVITIMLVLPLAGLTLQAYAGDKKVEKIKQAEPGHVITDSDNTIMVEQKPEIVYQAVPEYPEALKKKNIEGKVLMAAYVNKEGEVKKAEVKKSSGYEIMDKAATVAAYQNKYKPAIQNGEPIGCWVSYKVTFDLDAKDAQYHKQQQIQNQDQEKQEAYKKKQAQYQDELKKKEEQKKKYELKKKEDQKKKEALKKKQEGGGQA